MSSSKQQSQYFCNTGREIMGPLTAKEVRDLARHGFLKPMHEIRKGIDGPWSKADSVGGLFSQPYPADIERQSNHNESPFNAFRLAAIVGVLVFGLLASIGSRQLSSVLGYGLGALLLVMFSIVVYAAVVFLYFLPTVKAVQRDHKNKVPIAIVNVFFGWTLIGWVGCLAWSMSYQE